jgi:ABC-type uncharacterized transport system auxiliary subunit
MKFARILPFAALLSASCSILSFDRPPETHFALRFPGAAAERGTPLPGAHTLAVGEIRASGLLSGNRILFSRDGLSRGYYQLAKWSEPPGNRVQAELIQRLERSGNFLSVTRAGGLATSDLLLDLELLDAYHDISFEPGTVRVSLRVELISLREGKVLRSVLLNESSTATEYSAKGAVEGMQRAFSLMFERLETWLRDGVWAGGAAG